MYPMGLQLRGRRVLMVGGKTVAHRRLPRLLDEGADIVVVAPEVHTSVQALAESKQLRWHARGFLDSDMDGVWLVVVATDDASVNNRISQLSEENCTFCVRSDDASRASAWTPAVVRQEPFTVASFADGDPRRAAALRDAIAEQLVELSIAAPAFRNADKPAIGEVALVGAGPGDAELITLAGMRALRNADTVIVDRLVPAQLLEDLRDEVEIIDAAKISYSKQAVQDDIITAMIQRAANGQSVVRLKGGDPFVFGRGGEELDACTEAGIAVRIIPGVSSALAAPALAAVPVTERGLVHEFVVVSGHVPPDDPNSLVDWHAVSKLSGTIVLLMAVRNLPAIVTSLIAGGRDSKTPAVAIMNAGTSRQRISRSTLESIADGDVESPAVVVIGEVGRQKR